MSGEVFWLLELNVNLGRENEFRSLMAEMVAAAETNEPRTLTYLWNLHADGTMCHIYERYADSEAALEHLRNFQEKFASRFLDVLAPTRFVVYGSPSDELKEALTGFLPFYMHQVGGFAR
jgi:quinol monooxygenase YgiN